MTLEKIAEEAVRRCDVCPGGHTVEELVVCRRSLEAALRRVVEECAGMCRQVADDWLSTPVMGNPAALKCVEAIEQYAAQGEREAGDGD